MMHPAYPGIPATLPTKVSASLPAVSGRTLFFLSSINDGAAQHADADGVQLVFSLDTPDHFTYTATVDNMKLQSWVPIKVALPSYAGAATLTVSILPRATTYYDTTYLAYIGTLK
jgi:hypothetical protein